MDKLILIVSTHSLIGGLLQTVVTRLGYNVRRATSVVQALSIQAAERPNLVILDSELDFSTPDFLSALAIQDPTVPVVVLIYFAVDLDSFPQVKATIFKPFLIAELETLIKTYLT